MADKKITDLTSLASGSVDRATDVIEIADVSASSSKKVTPNAFMGISGAAVGDTDTQTLTNKALTSPTVSSPVLSGTITGTYTIGGTPTFPAAVVTLTSAQTLTNKILTSPTINTATISNPTLTTDTVSEHTAANGVAIDGLNIKDSKLNTNNSVVTANITNAAVTADKLSTGIQAVTVATSETTTSITYVALATAQAVTVTVGANGILIVCVNAQMSNSGANFSSMAFVLSGANTLAASTDRSVTSLDAAGALMGSTYVRTGLTPGSTTVTAVFAVGAGTGTFSRRHLWALPL